MSAYEAPISAWRHPPSPSALVSPETSAGEAPSSGHESGTRQIVSGREIDGSTIVELQPELMRVEADRDAEVAELEDTMARRSGGRKFSWEYS